MQLHHAAQLVTAAGISFLPPRPDDSHTNLEWIASLGALASGVIPTGKPFRVAVRPAGLLLMLLDGDAREVTAAPLNGQTLDGAAEWLKQAIAPRGADPARFTLRRHYEIPDHPVAHGKPFDISRVENFADLSAWFALGSSVLEQLRASNPQASAVRCWPHHFDIATLITAGKNKTIGVGLEPGDTYYDEPYFYVNANPLRAGIRGEDLPPLDGSGVWHTNDWTGAVLPAHRMPSQADAQVAAVHAFIASAVAAARTLAG